MIKDVNHYDIFEESFNMPFALKWNRSWNEKGQQKSNHVPDEGHLSASLERKK